MTLWSNAWRIFRTLNSNVVLFYCVLAGQIEGNKAADKCLSLTVAKWITIRGFSFAKTILENYRQDTKKWTDKAKTLCRASLFS